MLDNFQRITVEAVREHRGRISIALDNDEGTQVSTAFPDERLSKDINNNLAITAKGFSGKEAVFGDKVIIQIRKKQ